MALAQSKITAQGQISIPAVVRKKLGVAPGSTIEWNENEENGQLTVKRAGLYTFDDLHRAAFPDGPPEPKTLKQLKEGIADYMRERYGKR